MKQAVRLAIAVVCLSFAAVTAVTAQVPYNQGPVERVVLLKLTPGHFDALMADFKKNVVPALGGAECCRADYGLPDVPESN